MHHDVIYFGQVPGPNRCRHLSRLVAWADDATYTKCRSLAGNVRMRRAVSTRGPTWPPSGTPLLRTCSQSSSGGSGSGYGLVLGTSSSRGGPGSIPMRTSLVGDLDPAVQWSASLGVYKKSYAKLNYSITDTHSITGSLDHSPIQTLNYVSFTH